MSLDGVDLRRAYYTCSEVLRNRRLTGAPIPQWLKEHHQRLDALVRGFAPSGASDGVPGDSAQQSAHDAVIGSAQVARLLGIAPREVRRRAEQLGGTLVAGRWLFLREAVADYAARGGH
jgi:hypothetical protein